MLDVYTYWMCINDANRATGVQPLHCPSSVNPQPISREQTHLMDKVFGAKSQVLRTVFAKTLLAQTGFQAFIIQLQIVFHVRQ